MLREQDKHFLGTLYFIAAVVFFWKGIWLGWYELPYINNPYAALFVGLAMLTLSGLVFREFDPLGGLARATQQALQQLQEHPQKKYFQIKYHDKNLKKDLFIDARHLRQVGTNVLIFWSKGREHFIPIHRVKEVLYKGKTYWRF
ncbi:MAG: hypothetical protein AB1668_00830 [Nanoarchaeota archaeon]